MMRIRIHFAKTDEMRFTGHLDLYRSWERTLRRANLPLTYSQGFNPHPKINLAAALPLGFTGQDELLDTWLDTPLPVDMIQTALQTAAPPGITIKQVYEVEERAPTLQTLVQASDYEITFLDSFPELDGRLQSVIEAPVLRREWRGKPYDLRPLIMDLQQMPDDDLGRQRIYVRLTIREGATGRPEEVVSALGFSPLAILAKRVRLVFQAS